MSLSGLNISTKVTCSHCCDAFFQYDLFKVPDLDNLGEDQDGEPFQLLELEAEQELEVGDDDDEQVEQIGWGQEEEGEQEQQVEEQLPLVEEQIEEQIEEIEEGGINEVQEEVVVSIIVHF